MLYLPLTDWLLLIKIGSMMVKPEFLSLILQETRTTLDRFYKVLPVRALEAYELPNGWSVKDLLANLAAWDTYVVVALQRGDGLYELLHQALTEAVIEERDYLVYKERQDWTWLEVEQEATFAFDELVAMVKNLEHQQALSSDVQNLIHQITVVRYQKYIPILQRYVKQQQRRRT